MFLSVFPHALQGYRKQGWSLELTVYYIVRRIVKEMHLFYPSIVTYMLKHIMKEWIVRNPDGYDYFDFKGAKIPWIEPKKNCQMYEGMPFLFLDTFTIRCLYNDEYTKENVAKADETTPEGPYGYTDGKFDVTVKKGDVVIDAGAWIGDFSAYAASKGALCYAFEPTPETYEYLKITSDMNKVGEMIYIMPVNKGLGEKEAKLFVLRDADAGSGSNKLVENPHGGKGASIEVTTIDDFVRENNLQRVDFIKSDIEGAERDMLRGARETLRRFAPKLAICTYHLPDDPQVLEQIIKEANPDYTVVHLRHKLMAMVVK